MHATEQPLLEGLTHRWAGNGEAARAAFEAARSALDSLTSERPDDPGIHRDLGFAYAGLGRASDAIRHGQRAQELRPLTHYALSGSGHVLNLARIYGMVGQPEAAIEQIDRYLSGPGRWSLEGLLLHPALDALRDHPAFEELVAKWGRP